MHMHSRLHAAQPRLLRAPTCLHQGHRNLLACSQSHKPTPRPPCRGIAFQADPAKGPLSSLALFDTHVRISPRRPRRDIAFQADPAKGRPPRPYAEREKPKGAFGDCFPQIVPSAPDSEAVRSKG